jgi:hypothetical protein
MAARANAPFVTLITARIVAPKLVLQLWLGPVDTIVW